MIPFLNAMSIFSESAGDPYSGADIVLDFAGVKNGGVPFYRRDGVVHATAALAGFTGTGTFGAAGYTARGTARLEGTVTIPGDFIIYGEFEDPNDSPQRRLWRLAGAEVLQVFSESPGFSTFPATTTASSATRAAFGRSGGLAKGSFDGSTTVSGSSVLPPGSGRALLIGNQHNGSTPFYAPIKLIMVVSGTLSDAEIQALGA